MPASGTAIAGATSSSDLGSSLFNSADSFKGRRRKSPGHSASRDRRDGPSLSSIARGSRLLHRLGLVPNLSKLNSTHRLNVKILAEVKKILTDMLKLRTYYGGNLE